MTKTRILVFLSAFLFSIAGASLLASEAKIGESAPDFSLIDIEGNAHRLSDYKGKTVVLEWVNPECPFVVKHYRSGNIPSLQKAATEEGVVWLAINSGKSGAQGDYAPQQALGWMAQTDATPSAYMRDSSGEVGRQYGAKTTPHMFVITPEGVLAYDGAIDSIASTRDQDIAKAENYVTQALNALKTGQMPSTTKSRPYGCSVKY